MEEINDTQTAKIPRKLRLIGKDKVLKIRELTVKEITEYIFLICRGSFVIFSPATFFINCIIKATHSICDKVLDNNYSLKAMNRLTLF